MSLQIGGIREFSTIDCPGHISTVVFVQGCPWRCRYCHNTSLQPLTQGSVNWDSFLLWLESRVGKLDTVVFSGGEPTHQLNALFPAIDDVKSMGFSVGLHTTGMYELGMASLAKMCAWVGFDYKAPIPAYPAITGTIRGRSCVENSLKSFLAHTSVEVRTTWDSEILTVADCITIAKRLHELGATKWVLQQCGDDKTNLKELADMANNVVSGLCIEVR